MQLGASVPVGDIGTGPVVLRDYAQAAEGLGYDYLVAPDHVLGGNPNVDHGGRRVGTTATAYHDPFVLFAYLAGVTQKVGFCVGVLILAQRQAALVAKQTFKGEFHQLDDGGINPRPKSGKVPVWFGGHAEATFKRAAKYGDGFMPLAYPAGDKALAAFDKLRGMIKTAGRDPASVGLEVWMSPGNGTEDDWRKEFEFWKKAGVTHVVAHTTYVSNHHKRIPGKSYDDHLSTITRFHKAVKDLLP
jgi:alkanesulfonate monooxygenase SsuD/methylene tetrahydromethanopterin reductase-like flavin-dependent oxidoreductase (luciferase family)